MIRFIFLLFLFIHSALVCQIVDSTKANKFEIGLTYSPDYCFRTLKSDQPVNWVLETRDTLEVAKFGYTTGLNFVYNLSKNISIGSGFLFSDKGKKTKLYSLENSVSGKLPINNTIIYHHYYIDVPIKANYFILTGKLKLYLTGGICASLFLVQSNVSIWEYSDGHTERNSTSSSSGFSKINFAYIAGFGLDFSLSQNFNFRIEPGYRRSINSISDTPIKEYLYTSGLSLGIFYKL